ncbi:hypothetical protein [Mycolicibacterium brisbanense]|uniref:Gp11 n=1 Tax=Mycolicibacterium brisbanense TaxID=146020 RepID=A0A124E163_9MYCO|nr:hypothetical protein [Mycolicibacterium brisbanense]MCV7158038.1 hypothetical protein [Mycolicibacterium brisbanense]GAS92688.1 Gp11 [Mycolicibacterium brisbanense]
MTSPTVYGPQAPSGVTFVTAWLSPLAYSASRHNPGDPLPATMVDKIGGTGDLAFSDPLISVHTLAGATPDLDADTAAYRLSNQVHARMLYLEFDPAVVITTADGISAGVDYFDVVEEPVKIPYRDTDVIQYVSRYRLGFTLA